MPHQSAFSRQQPKPSKYTAGYPSELVTHINSVLTKTPWTGDFVALRITHFANEEGKLDSGKMGNSPKVTEQSWPQEPDALLGLLCTFMVSVE